MYVLVTINKTNGKVSYIGTTSSISVDSSSTLEQIYIEISSKYRTVVTSVTFRRIENLKYYNFNYLLSRVKDITLVPKKVLDALNITDVKYVQIENREDLILLHDGVIFTPKYNNQSITKPIVGILKVSNCNLRFNNIPYKSLSTLMRYTEHKTVVYFDDDNIQIDETRYNLSELCNYLAKRFNINPESVDLTKWSKKSYYNSIVEKYTNPYELNDIRGFGKVSMLTRGANSFIKNGIYLTKSDLQLYFVNENAQAYSEKKLGCYKVNGEFINAKDYCELINSSLLDPKEEDLLKYSENEYYSLVEGDKLNVRDFTKGYRLDVKTFMLTDSKKQKVKANRVIRRIIFDEMPCLVKDSKKDKFVEYWFDILNNTYNCKFIYLKGSDIKNGFIVENYYKEMGSLGSSCMNRSIQRGIGIRNSVFYEKNSKIELLTMNNDQGKIIARVVIYDRKYYSRIYSVDKTIEHSLNNFCLKNGFKSIYTIKKGESIIEKLDYKSNNGGTYLDGVCINNQSLMKN